MGVMMEKIVELEEEDSQKQEVIDRHEKRIHELENPRRSKRIMGMRLKKKQKK